MPAKKPKIGAKDRFKEILHIHKGIHSERPKLTSGQRAADVTTKWVGSWTFIFLLFVFMAAWMYLNVMMVINRWDPYPFILLNFVLSTLAAIQAPIILMSQNRAADRDRAKAERDYMVNRKAEKEVQEIQKDLDEIKRLINRIKGGKG